jgi:hypothetical protein
MSCGADTSTVILPLDDLTGITVGRAQAQHALSAMRGSAASAPNRRLSGGRAKEREIEFLSFASKGEAQHESRGSREKHSPETEDRNGEVIAEWKPPSRICISTTP